MKQNKQIFFKFPFYFSPKHDLIDDSVLNRLDDKSSYSTERFYLESHVNFFQKSIFRLPVLDWIQLNGAQNVVPAYYYML